MTDRRERLAAALGVFMKQYGRKAQKGREPNDRQYDRHLEQRMKSVDPTELDALLREGFDEPRHEETT